MEVTGYTDAETWEFVHIVDVAVAAFDEVPPNPADGSGLAFQQPEGNRPESELA